MHSLQSDSVVIYVWEIFQCRLLPANTEIHHFSTHCNFAVDVNVNRISWYTYLIIAFGLNIFKYSHGLLLSLVLAEVSILF